MVCEGLRHIGNQREKVKGKDCIIGLRLHLVPDGLGRRRKSNRESSCIQGRPDVPAPAWRIKNLTSYFLANCSRGYALHVLPFETCLIRLYKKQGGWQRL